MLLSVFLLVGCSKEGVESGVYNKGDDIIQMIHSSFVKKTELTENEIESINIFLEDNNFDPSNDNFENENDNFVYHIAWLELLNSHYLLSLRNGDLEKAKSKEQEYKDVLTYLQENYNIEIKETD